MSKLAVFLAVPALAVAAGLGVVCVGLLDQVDELTARIDELESRPPGPRGGEDASAASARPSMSRADQARVRAMEERLVVVEERLVATPARAAASDEPDTGAPAALPGVPGDAAFRRAVEGVLDARDAERRAEKMTRVADARTRQLLRDVEVSDAQRGDVLRVVTDGLRRREESRELDLEPELERERNEELRGELTRALEGILDAGQMDVVRTRIDIRRRARGDNSAGPDQRPRGGKRRRATRPGDDA